MEKRYLGKLGYLVLKSRLPALHSCHGPYTETKLTRGLLICPGMTSYPGSCEQAFLDILPTVFKVLVWSLRYLCSVDIHRCEDIMIISLEYERFIETGRF